MFYLHLSCTKTSLISTFITCDVMATGVKSLRPEGAAFFGTDTAGLELVPRDWLIRYLSKQAVQLVQPIKC